MLTNHNGPLLSDRNVFWKAEPSPRWEVFPRVDLDFVNRHGFGFTDEVGARLKGKEGFIQTSNGVSPERFTSLIKSGLEALQIVGWVGLACSLCPTVFDDGDEVLAVVLKGSYGFALSSGEDGGIGFWCIGRRGAGLAE